MYCLNKPYNMRKMRSWLQKRDISTETSVFIRREMESEWRNMGKEGKVVGEEENWEEEKEYKRRKPDWVKPNQVVSPAPSVARALRRVVMWWPWCGWSSRSLFLMLYDLSKSIHYSSSATVELPSSREERVLQSSDIRCVLAIHRQSAGVLISEWLF